MQVNDTLDPRSTVVLLGIVVIAEEEGRSTMQINVIKQRNHTLCIQSLFFSIKWCKESKTGDFRKVLFPEVKTCISSLRSS